MHLEHNGQRQRLGWRSDSSGGVLYVRKTHPQNECGQPHKPNRQPEGGADDSRAAARLLTGWERLIAGLLWAQSFRLPPDTTPERSINLISVNKTCVQAVHAWCTQSARLSPP